jgi:dienelactone hydrolase
MAKAGPNQPVVVILHGAGGIGPRHSPQDEWAWVLNEAGISTFMVDSFSGRNINTFADVEKVSPLGMIADAFAALEVLSKHPLVDPKKVVVMGLSYGSLAAIYSDMARFQKQYGGQKFAANISIYGGCGTKFREDEAITNPILFLHGVSDDWVPIGPCREYVARLKASGKDARIFEYPDSLHAFDGPAFGALRKLPDVKTWTWCRFEEVTNGVLNNVETGKPLAPTDACWRTGVSLGFNEAAMNKAHEDALAFLKDVLK